MIKFNVESWEKFYKDGLPLMEDNSSEVNIFGVPLQLNTELYENMDKVGVLKCFTARDNGRLIGYAVFLVSHHMNYSSIKTASQVVIYIVPGKRTTGIRLIKYSEAKLKKMNVDIVTQGAPEISRLGGVLERLGYEKLETIYKKEL